MTPSTEEIKKNLVDTHDEFRRLKDEHSTFERRLADLSRKTFLSADEELEEKRLKKQKLALKDRMEQIVREYRARVETAS